MKIRVLLLLLLLLVVAAAVAGAPLAAQGGGDKQRVKTTKREVESIGMDGPLVAYDLKADEDCNEVFVWNVNTNGGKLVSGKGTCEADDSSTGAGVTEVAVAGKRIAWITNEGGNTESDDDLYTASLPNPKEKHLLFAMRTGDIDGQLDGDWIGGLFGDGDLIAVSTWTTAGGKITRSTVRLVAGDGLKTIVKVKGPSISVAAGSGRIAVAGPENQGQLALYSQSGRLLRRLPGGAETALTGDRVITHSGRNLRVFNARTGAEVATWRAPVNAYRLDAEGDVAVYSLSCGTYDTCGRNVFAVRVSTGKTVRLARTAHELVGLQVEPAGVVYAYNGPKGGKIVLTPLSQVEAALR